MSLTRWRAWYAEGDTGKTPGAGDGQGDGKGEEGYNPASLDDAKKIIAALEKRVGERDAQIGTLRQSNNGLDERLKAIEDAQKQRLEKQGDFEELARQRAAEIESLKPTAERAKALEQVIRESNEARVKRVPEAMRSVVPADYPPEKLQAWLNANEALLTKAPAPNFDGGAGNGGSGGSSREPELTAEEKAMTSLMGLTPEQYAAAKKTLGLK